MKTKITKTAMMAGLMTALTGIFTRGNAQVCVSYINTTAGDPTFTFSATYTCNPPNTNTTCISYYSWNFGDGNTVTSISPMVFHTYTVNGTYTVSLSIVDSCLVGPVYTYSPSFITVNVNNAPQPPLCTLSLVIVKDTLAGPGNYVYNYTYSPGSATVLSYNWYIMNWNNTYSTSASGPSPTFTLPSATSYDVCLVTILSTNSGTCWASSCHLLPVDSTYSGPFISVYKMGTPTVIGKLNENYQRVTLFPNPVQDILNIQVTESQNTVIIRDISGRELRRQSFISKTIQLPVSGLQPGTYFIEVLNPKGKTTKLFMKE